jgi:hypothetical protein
LHLVASILFTIGSAFLCPAPAKAKKRSSSRL